MKDEAFEPILTPELLLHAYSIGIFPMAEHQSDPEVFWVDPRRRGILPLDSFHISRSLARRMRQADVSATLDRCFEQVLRSCADREETWINDEIFDLYMALHQRGKAHSLEVWYGDQLAGGAYGVALGGAFFGESMFSAARDGSKVALACLTQHLRACGFTLFDTQFTTPHLLSLGAQEITRAAYHRKLDIALRKPVSITSRDLLQPQAVVQRMTHTS